MNLNIKSPRSQLCYDISMFKFIDSGMFNKRFLAAIAVVSCAFNLAFGYELTILHTNDIHGRIAPIEYYKDQKPLGGWARRIGLIKKIKLETPNTLVLDAGDIYQGSVYYQLFDGMPEMGFLNDAGYDAICVGNHELDRGIAQFENLVKMSQVPFLSANIEFKKNFFLNGKIKSHIIKDYNGYRVAVIGMTTPELNHLTTFDEFEQPDYEKTLQFFINYLKNDVDLVVLLSHSGADRDIETAKNISGIDVIVGGHSHTFMEKAYLVKKNGRKTLVVQDGEFGVKLGRLDIDFDKNGIEKYSYKLIPLDETVPVDKKTVRKVAEMDDDIEKIRTEKLGTTTVAINCKRDAMGKGLTNGGEFVLEALLKSAPSADVAMINSGTIRGNKIIPKGKLTKMDILEMLPFANNLVVVDLTGRELKSILETSARYVPHNNEGFLQTKGISYIVDLKGEPQILSEDLEKVTKEGSRIKNVKIKGKELDEDATYKILTTDFLFSGGDGYTQFKRTPDFSKTDCSVTNLVIDYIKTEKKVHPAVEDKVIVEE